MRRVVQKELGNGYQAACPLPKLQFNWSFQFSPGSHLETHTPPLIWNQTSYNGLEKSDPLRCSNRIINFYNNYSTESALIEVRDEYPGNVAGICTHNFT